MSRIIAVTLLSLLVAFAAQAEPPADKLPPGAVARLGSYRFYHGGPINAMAIAPDGKLIATIGQAWPYNSAVGQKDSLFVFDARTGERRWSKDDGIAWCYPVAFSPDNKEIVVDAGESVQILDAATGALKKTLVLSTEVQFHPTREFVFSADNRELIRIDSASGVKWYDLSTGKVTRERTAWPDGKPAVADETRQETCPAAAIAPDRSVVAFAISRPVPPLPMDNAKWEAGPGPIRIVDVASGKIVREFDLKQKCLRLEFSPDGRVLMAFSPEGARLLSGNNGKEILFAENTLVNAPEFSMAAFSPDGRTFLYISLHSAKLYNVADGKEIGDLPESMRGAMATFSPDGRYIASRFFSLDAPLKLQLCEVATRRLVFERVWMCAPNEELMLNDRRPHFFPDGKTVAMAHHSWIQTFDAMTGKEPLDNLSHLSAIAAVSFADRGQTLRAMCSIYELTWDIAGRQLRRFRPFVDVRAFDPTVRMFDLSPDAKSFVGRKDDNPPAIYDFETRKTLCVLASKFTDYESGVFSPDGRYLALQRGGLDEKFVDFFEVATGKMIGKLDDPAVKGMSGFTPDGSLFIYGDKEKALVLLDWHSRKVVKRIEGLFHENRNHNAGPMISPDGRSMAVLQAPTADRITDENPLSAWIYAIPSGRETGHIVFPSIDSVWFQCDSFQFSPDGRLAIAVRRFDPVVHVWETASGLSYCKFTGHHLWVNTFELSPDGGTIASGGEDGVVYLWDLAYPQRAHRTKTPDLTHCWTALAGPDVAKAWAAIADLAEQPESVKFLKEKLQPVRSIPAKEITQRVEKLSSDSFDEREQATRELAGFYEGAQKELQNSQNRELPPEARRRVQALLDTLNNPNLNGDRLRQWRAVAVMERIGTADAKKLLEVLATGLPEARLTIAANDALARLRSR
jgi:WD40 repeat protein